ncbi:MAG: AzlD domain-containing protein [Hyphomicrobiaceae bacterium]|nr:AzlD domain-containing protein [Hyphomicrobiaceae bacterium]
MSAVPDGLAAYAVLVLAGVLPTEMWRWLGVIVGNRLAVEGALFQWVRLVAAALVAAMVSRMLLYPAGTLAGVPWTWRMGAFLAAVAIYLGLRRNLAAGVASGALILLAVEVLRG